MRKHSEEECKLHFGKTRLVCEKNTREMMGNKRALMMQSKLRQVKARLP